MRRQIDTASSRSSRRVNPVDHRNADQSAAAAVVEKVLPNGDLYVGASSHCVPHGPGKYLWRDGCMCEGHWRRGSADGVGKFSWPSGATYEGDFRSGRMEGLGTFTGPGGDTYRGSWSAGRKHGHGSKSYSNGDFYVGEWRDGAIAGLGVLFWSNGSRYDGNWESGAPVGSGVFTWPDGCCCIGRWSKDRLLNGTFYPPVVEADGRRSSGENNFPRICIRESDGEAGDITCGIVDNMEAASLLYRNSSVKVFDTMTGGGEAKKPGQTISKGHKNYDLMINLQLGIAYSVGKSTGTQMRGLRPEDFDPREKYWTRFPPEGSRTTPPHQSIDFRWKDYCPLVFRHLRKLFAVDPGDYMMAICGSDALRELSSPGKSGSFFYLTQDGRFMIKTVKKSEAKVLIRMLPCYYKHMFLYENSLVTKFFSVHCVKPFGGQKVRFIVMGNLFCSEHQIHRRFDLKGSSYGRTTDKTEEEIDETTTLKDLDLNFVFRLQQPLFLELLGQIDRDCHFLEAVGIMDYSLLVGLHFRDNISASKLTMSPCAASPRNCGKRDSEYSFTEPDRKDPAILDSRKPTRLGSNMPARAVHLLETYPLLVGGGGWWMPSHSNEIHDVVLYCGIIDILQNYDVSKKLEHAYKSLQVDPSSISAVDPKLYSRRFRDFIRRVFVDDC